MKYFLFGIVFTYFIQYSTSYYVTRKYSSFFVNECGVRAGYKGMDKERQYCLDQHMKYFHILALVVLGKPQYHTHGKTFNW